MIERLNPQSNPPKFDLESAFLMYHPNLIRTAENELKRQGVKNYKTVAPDIVQNIYLRLQNTSQIFPETKAEFLMLLLRNIQSEANSYVKYVARDDPKHPNSYTFRQSHLRPLEEARQISIKPVQENLDLKELIKSANLNSMQKKILIAHYVEEKTLEEIAEEYGFNSRQAVHGQEMTALKILKQDPKFKILLSK